MGDSEQQLLARGEQAIAIARAAGATAADVLLINSTDLTAGMRHGLPETIERAESCGFGLRVFVGQASATLSSSDMSKEAMQRTAETAVAIARVAPADPFSGLADEKLLARTISGEILADTHEPSMQQLQDMAKRCEAAGRNVAGITNSEGADAAYSSTTVALVTSHGFAHSYSTSRHMISCSLIAGLGDQMQRDYDYATTVFHSDLPAAEIIGASAAQRTLARMHPRKIASQTAPVFFEPRAGRQLLSAFASAISGTAITRGTSFLKDALGTQVFAPGITIIDNPLLPRGLASHPFDAEGIAAQEHHIVVGGVVKHWLLDCRSANQLGLQTTGHASRGLSSAPHPSATNFYMQPGTQSPDALFASVPNGLLVTETIGHGVNLITGDYSVGASGFWIENGQRTYPVSEITIAGNLRDMYGSMVAANDLVFRYATNTPTLMVPAMTIAGN